jgi:hypothetical protein
MPRLFNAIDAGRAGVDHGIRAGRPEEKRIPPVVDGPACMGRAAQSSRAEDGPFLPGVTRGTCGTAPAGRITSWCPAANPVGSTKPGHRFRIDLRRGLLEEGGRGVILVLFELAYLVVLEAPLFIIIM